MTIPLYQMYLSLYRVENIGRVEISGPGTEKAFEEVLVNEIGYTLIHGAHPRESVAYGQGGITEAEHIAERLLRCGFFIELKVGEENILNIKRNRIRDAFLVLKNNDQQ